MSEQRFNSFEEFFPFYLSEHENANSRRLHFVGTTGWFASLAASTVANPVGFPLAMAGFGLIMRDAIKRENEGPAFKHMAAMLALPTLASPIFLGGVVWAYGCAWAGHFLIEKNRPATFKQPIWSLYGDFKMWTHMLRGRLWSGENPIEELQLAELDNTRSAPARVAAAVH
ncbi:MAG: DUF962 domain-containing protein [Myxococcota bacterium]